MAQQVTTKKKTRNQKQSKPKKHQTVVLCMIVKDEATVIERCFDSVKNIVDYYVICDTGSTDGTQNIISEYLKKHKFKGEVHDRPWISFCHNRQEAFDLGVGKGDYIMTMDADEVFVPFENGAPVLTKKNKTLPKFVWDKVDVRTCMGTFFYNRVQFFKNGLNWKWNYPVHEVCSADNCKSSVVLDDCCIVPNTDGGRAKDEKRFLRDALTLQNYLIDNPKCARSWFYLSQSYRDAGEIDKAIPPLFKVLEFSNWDEEKYLTLLRIGRFKLSQGKPFSEAEPYFLKAYQQRPTRRESLRELLRYYRKTDQHHLAILFGEKAIKISFPLRDILFVESDTYEWCIEDDLSVSYYWTGRYQESYDLCYKILNNKAAQISAGDRERIKKNLDFSEEKIV